MEIHSKDILYPPPKDYQHTDCPLHSWTILFNNGPFSKYIQTIFSIYGPSCLYMDHPLHTWIILSIHGPSSLYMDHLRSKHMAIHCIHIDRLLYSGIYISIHGQYSLFRKPLLDSWISHSVHIPLYLYTDHLIHTCILSIHIISIYIIIFVLGPSIYISNSFLCFILQVTIVFTKFKIDVYAI